MTKQINFGRRTAEDRRQAWDEYRGEMGKIGRQMPIGKWVLGVLGIYVAVSVLIHSGKTPDAGVAAVQSAQKPAVTSSSTVSRLVKPCEASLREYSSLTTGMSLRQAVSIIGCAGEEMSRVSTGDQESVMVSWPGNGGFFTSMNATFDDDRLVAKGQLGLE